MDFAAILFTATVVTGIIWFIDTRAWAPKRQQEVDRLKAKGVNDEEVLEKVSKEPLLVEYSRSFFPVILIVLLLRSFLVEPFRIPSGSMMPTLLVGDFILVNKFSYGLRLPVLNTKFISIGEPVRGDVVVFRYPNDPAIDYIKRVVGLPGDKISYRNKKVFVNGEAMEAKYKGVYTGTKSGLPMIGVSLYEETLGDVKHEILIERSKPSFTPSFDGDTFIVPDGHYFVMGDNRDNSNDSRIWGTVPEQNLVGKAFFIWMNWNWEDEGIKWSRIGSSIE